MFLEQLGADARVRTAFAATATAGQELARVCFAAQEEYRIYLECGECEAVPAGRLRYEEELPVVGDWVAARRVDEQMALLEAVLPRRTQVARRAVGRASSAQVMAANIDLVVIVCGLDGDFNVRRLERYLVVARESTADVLVVLNKADVCEDVGLRVDEVRAVTQGTPILGMSAHAGVEDLRQWIGLRTVAFFGSSGVGKSTIVNGLLGEARQDTLAVRASDSRGRHTTTNRMLLPMPGGGAVIDTPGMREVQLWASEGTLDEVFGDVAALATGCRFGDCAHGEEPGCAVRKALAEGTLDAARFHNYEKLQAELRREARRDNPLAQAAETNKWKVIHKAMRHHPKRF